MQKQQHHTYRGEEEYGGHEGGRHNAGQQLAPGRNVWQKARSCVKPADLAHSVHTHTGKVETTLPHIFLMQQVLISGKRCMSRGL